MAHFIWKQCIRYEIVPLIVPNNLHFGKLKCDHEKGFKRADVMGAVQQNAFFSIQSDNTVLNKILRENNLLGHSGHLDEKNYALNNIFPISSPSDINDLAMTYIDYMNGLKM